MQYLLNYHNFLIDYGSQSLRHNWALGSMIWRVIVRWRFSSRPWILLDWNLTRIPDLDTLPLSTCCLDYSRLKSNCCQIAYLLLWKWTCMKAMESIGKKSFWLDQSNSIENAAGIAQNLRNDQITLPKASILNSS